MVKKWQTLIDANIDVKTTDGYLLRVFCIGFTSKDQLSQRKTCYAQHSQVRAIRKKMCDIITRDITSSDLKEVVNKLLPDSIAKDIEKVCQGIYPLHDVYIRKVCFSAILLLIYQTNLKNISFKVKVLKKPRFDISKLLELHGDGGGKGTEGVISEGAIIDRPEGYEPPVQESV